MTPDEEALASHKARLAAVGLIYTEPYGPTDMSKTDVQERMQAVVESARRMPSIFNSQNDFDLANQVRMLTRRDSAHETVVCAARDRIFELSLRNAELEKALTAAKGELEEAAAAAFRAAQHVNATADDVVAAIRAVTAPTPPAADPVTLAVLDDMETELSRSSTATVAPAPADGLVERLKPRHVSDEPLARAVVSDDLMERRRAVSAFLVANNALKSEAAAALTSERELRQRYQRERAELYDKLVGTPCAEVRWAQEREALEKERDEARRGDHTESEHEPTWAELTAAWKAKAEAAEAQVSELAAAGRRILPYLTWTIGEESPGHHPTMPSAVAAFRTVFLGRGAEAEIGIPLGGQIDHDAAAAEDKED